MDVVRRSVWFSSGSLLAVAALGASLSELLDHRGLVGAALAVALTLIVAALLSDFRLRRIPNAWTYPGLLAGFGLSLLAGAAAVLAALGGALVAGGLFLMLSLISRGGLGLGDVKLAAALGAFVGPQGAVDLVLVTAVAGGLLAWLWLATGHGRREALPYAPAVAVGGLTVLVAMGPLVS